MNSTFISLESLEIARPCRANWNAMSGDEQVRFCQSCEKNVYNFSEMTRDEAMRLLLQREGHLCVRLHRRTDGTVITSDCPVGETQPKRARGFRFFAMAVGFVAGLFGLRGVFASDSGPITVTAGAPMFVAPTPAPVKSHANASRTTRPRAVTRAKRSVAKTRHQRHRG